MGKTKKKQVEKVFLEDHYGSWSQAFLMVRSVLWGMVEQIVTTMDEDTTVDNTTYEDFDEKEVYTLHTHGLPASFSSSKQHTKRKRVTQEKIKQKCSRSSDPTTNRKLKLPMLDDDGNKLIEQNIGFVRNKDGSKKWFRILGVAPSLLGQKELTRGSELSTTAAAGATAAAPPTNDMMKVRYLQTKEICHLNRMNDDVFFASNTSYEPLAYQQAEADLWYSFSWDKPIDVHEKYWDQRYRIFRKFDDNVHLDAESWYSITYEQLAGYVATRCQELLKVKERLNDVYSVSSPYGCHLVLDCFSGCGGCTIPFALLPDSYVLAVDMDETKLKHLQHNCDIYGVGQKVECIQSDVWTLLHSWANPHRLSKLYEKIDKMFYCISNTSTFPAAPTATNEQVPDATFNEGMTETTAEGMSVSSVRGKPQIHSRSSQKVDIAVLSPPWGGPDYLEEPEYDLSTMLTCGDGLKLIAAAASVAETVVYIVPRNTINKQLTTLANILGCKYHIEDIHINNKCKVKVAYYGQF